MGWWGMAIDIQEIERLRRAAEALDDQLYKRLNSLGAENPLTEDGYREIEDLRNRMAEAREALQREVQKQLAPYAITFFRPD